MSEGSFILWGKFPDNRSRRCPPPRPSQPPWTRSPAPRPGADAQWFTQLGSVLAEAFRRDGESLAFDNPEFDGIQAAALQIVRTALQGLPEELLGPNGTWQAMDMYAVLGPKGNWARAQVGLNFLQAVLADERPIGVTTLEPPMDWWMGETLLRLQVSVPTPAVDELREPLRFVMAAMIREMVGPGVPVTVAVGPAEES